MWALVSYHVQAFQAVGYNGKVTVTLFYKNDIGRICLLYQVFCYIILLRISTEPILVILFSFKKILKDFSWCIKLLPDEKLWSWRVSKLFMFLYSIDHYQ